MLNIQNNSKVFKKIIVLVLLSTLSVSMYAQNCKSNIPNNYIDNTNGTITHKNTKLMWKKCSQGQTWSGLNNTCTRNTLSMNWKEALQSAEKDKFAGYDNWRVPNIKELGSLVELSCHNPSINEKIFPHTPSSSFWSSTPSLRNGNNSFLVNFLDGNDVFGNISSRDSSSFVRLVRIVK